MALATLGNLSRSFAELRVNVRSHLLATNDARARGGARGVRRGRTGRQPAAAEVRGQPGPRRQGTAAARRIPDVQPRVDRRREAGHGAGGRRSRREKRSLFSTARSSRTLVCVSARCRTNGSRTTRKRRPPPASESIAVIERFQLADAPRQLAGVPPDQPARLSDLPPDRHAHSGAGSIRQGNRRRRLRQGRPLRPSPRTKPAAWRARSTSSSRAPPRWTSNGGSSPTSRRLTGELQGAASLAEFGQRLLSGLVPMLGGGVAGFLRVRRKAGASAPRRRLRPCGDVRTPAHDPPR